MTGDWWQSLFGSAGMVPALISQCRLNNVRESYLIIFLQLLRMDDQ